MTTYATLNTMRGISPPPAKYELRMDFEHGLYSVAAHEGPSLDLDFLEENYRAEVDSVAGVRTLAEVVPITRAGPAAYRDSSGDLAIASADEARIHHQPPVVEEVIFKDFFDTDTSGNYTPANDTTVAVSAGDLVVTMGVSQPDVRISLGTNFVPGETYRIKVTFSAAGTASAGRISMCTSLVQNTFPGTVAPGGDLALGGAEPFDGSTQEAYFVPNASEVFLWIYGTGLTTGNTMTFSDFVVDRVHAITRKPSSMTPIRHGLLIEGQRTNKITQSEDASAAEFGGNLTVSSNVAPDPKGTTTADRLVTTATAVEQHRYRSLTGLTDGARYSLTAWVSFDGDYPYVSLRGISSGDQYGATFDVRTGEVTATFSSGNGTFWGAGAEDWGGGLFRIWVIGAITGKTSCYYWLNVLDPALGPTNTSRGAWTGNGTSGVNIWGMQFEAGNYPTSYIATSGSEATRPRDDSSDNPLGPVAVALMFGATIVVDATRMDADGNSAGLGAIFQVHGDRVSPGRNTLMISHWYGLDAAGFFSSKLSESTEDSVTLVPNKDDWDAFQRLTIAASLGPDGAFFRTQGDDVIVTTDATQLPMSENPTLYSLVTNTSPCAIIHSIRVIPEQWDSPRMLAELP